MSGYSWVAVVSLFFYVFLLLTFLATKKTKKVMRTFVALLGIMILWNGGSFGMRMQLWPTHVFWHHVSLSGMLMVTVGYFHFVLDFLEDKNGNGRWFWLIFYAAIFVINCLTNFFVPLPEVVVEGGHTDFLYHYSWSIYLLLAFIVVTLGHLALIIRRHCLGNHIAFRQLLPVISGLLIMLLGHTLATLPMFVGMPADMVSGVINAGFLFYALYKKRLFRMTILFSKANYCIIAVVVGIAIFSNFALAFQQFLIRQVGVAYAASLIIITVVLLLLIAAIYLILNAVFDAIFVRTERQQSERMHRFGEDITHMLNMEDILKALTDTIQETIGVKRIFVLIRGMDGQYRIEHTTNPLDEKDFYIRSDYPLLTCFKNEPSCITYQDYSRHTMYRSMWEREKEVLERLQIACFVPIVHERDIIGMVMLSRKSGKADYTPHDLTYLQTVTGLCAVAVRDAYIYEKAIDEAQRDSLTRLINRKFFFELLDREFERCRDSALSLCLLSIDDFKRYNQLYGTNEGNLALQRVAGVLSASVSSMGFAARVGGKEFALLLPGYDLYSAKCLAENVSEQINRINTSAAGKVVDKLTVSVGICAAPYIASTAKELYRNADSAMYTVKRNGKNAVLMYSANHNRKIAESSSHYKSGYNEHANTIYALTAAIDAKDHYTFQHSKNVAYYAAALAKAANMSPELVEIVREAGLLHDIGKISVREDILNKPDKLTQEEYDVIKSHVDNAINIIQNLPSLEYVIPAVRSHHERYDGTGYPRRLEGEDIPITGRILSIADAYDAITSVRCYKDASAPEEAAKILLAGAGRQFDPILAKIFAELVENGELEQQTPVSGELAVSLG